MVHDETRLLAQIELVTKRELPNAVLAGLVVVLHDLYQTEVVTSLQLEIEQLIADSQRNGAVDLVEVPRPLSLHVPIKDKRTSGASVNNGSACALKFTIVFDTVRFLFLVH